MALKIYRLDESTLEFIEISTETFDNPAEFSVRPGGTAVIKKFYLRNDDPTKYYTGLTLTPVTEVGDALVDNVTSIKLLSGDRQPTDERWASVGANSLATLVSPIVGAKDTRLPEIGAAAAGNTKYYPFWIRVEVSRGAPIRSSFFRLKLTYTENVVG